MQKQSGTQSWIDITNLIFGAALFVAPWFMGPAAHAVQWNAWIVGGLVACLAAGALASFAAWEEWSNLTLGVWAAISPWLFGFQADASATWTHLIIGCAVAALAGTQLWLINRQSPSVTA